MMIGASLENRTCFGRLVRSWYSMSSRHVSSADSRSSSDDVERSDEREGRVAERRRDFCFC